MLVRTTGPTSSAAALGLALALAGCGAATPEESTTASRSPESTRSAAPPSAGPTPSAEPETVDLSAEIGALEDQFAARVGVSVVDTGTGTTVEHRADERFGFASTIKLFAAAALLRDVPPGTWSWSGSADPQASRQPSRTWATRPRRSPTSSRV
nr:serine hydrolase [Cellulomonas sp. APG4]